MKKYTVRFTKEALADIDNIGNYIAIQLEEPGTALKIMEQLYKKCEKLSLFPKGSPIYAKIGGIYFRFAHCGNYIIAYYVDGAEVIVKTIIYSRRNIKAILQE